MTGHHVASNLLMIFVLLAGLMTLIHMKIEVFPDIETGQITVVVPYPGASPSEVEEGVCQRVEDAIAGVEGIKRIRSVAAENAGTVVAELEESADSRSALDDIKAAVDRIDTFPQEAERPVVSEVVPRRAVIGVVAHGNVGERTLKRLGERIRDDLLAKDTITQVELAGVRPYQIDVEISEESLRRYGLTRERVAFLISKQSLDIPGGEIREKGGHVLLRTKGQAYRKGDFEKLIVLSRPDGTVIRLGDMATVRDGFAETDTQARFDGEPAALVQVFRVGDQSALEIAREVKGYVKTFNQDLPPGVRVDVWNDDSEILKSRMGLLLRNGRMGLFLVFLCLALFVDLRLAFWATMGIPVSFLGAFWFLPFFDVSVNMVSLFAFIVTLGIVVDDAIVVGEAVYQYREKGMKPLDAAIAGVCEMATPVIFSVLTTIAAFLPLVVVAGRMGKIMRQIPVVVVAVLVVSLIEALFVLPAHLSRSRGKGSPGPIARMQGKIREGLARFVSGSYTRLLERAIRWRYLTLAIGVGILLLCVGAVAGGHVHFSFMPKVDSDNMIAALTMPQGTPPETTMKWLLHIEKAAQKVKKAHDKGRDSDEHSVYRHVMTLLGDQPTASRRAAGGPHGGNAVASSGSYMGEVNVELLGSEDRGVAAKRAVHRVCERPGSRHLHRVRRNGTARPDQRRRRGIQGGKTGRPRDVLRQARGVPVAFEGFATGVLPRRHSDRMLQPARQRHRPSGTCRRCYHREGMGV